MATEEKVPIEEVHVTERPLWLDGPPYEVFKRMVPPAVINRLNPRFKTRQG